MSTHTPRTPEWTFGDKLRKIRTESRLKQGEFAAMIGLTSSTLAAYETGLIRPGLR